MPWVNAYLRDNLTERVSNLSSSLPKRFRERGLVGHRLLTTERIVNERVLALDLVGKVGVRHVPCLRTSLVGLGVPFLTFTVVPRLHSFNTCILSKESGMPLSLSPSVWSTDSLSDSLLPLESLSLKALSDFPLVCRLKKALYGLSEKNPFYLLSQA